MLVGNRAWLIDAPGQQAKSRMTKRLGAAKLLHTTSSLSHAFFFLGISFVMLS
jgi:hypothetical protein